MGEKRETEGKGGVGGNGVVKLEEDPVQGQLESPRHFFTQTYPGLESWTKPTTQFDEREVESATRQRCEAKPKP